MDTQTKEASRDAPWNKGKLVGQKAPLRLNEIWAIRVRLQLSHRVWQLALFNLAIDSKLRACDLVKLRMQDVCHGDHIALPERCGVKTLMTSMRLLVKGAR